MNNIRRPTVEVLADYMYLVHLLIANIKSNFVRIKGKYSQWTGIGIRNSDEGFDCDVPLLATNTGIIWESPSSMNIFLLYE